MKPILIALGATVIMITGIVWMTNARNNDPDLISSSGIHWHPTLAIYVKGEKQEIPPNIGIGAVHQPMHTHEDDASAGVIHFEFQGSVKKQELTLGRFFSIWGKDFNSFGTLTKMTVNGTESSEREGYSIGEKDIIELWYE